MKTEIYPGNDFGDDGIKKIYWTLDEIASQLRSSNSKVRLYARELGFLTDNRKRTIRLASWQLEKIKKMIWLTNHGLKVDAAKKHINKADKILNLINS